MTTATSTVRKSADREGFRQAMSWLHTWAGLILGWLLFAIFLTGTLSFFKNEFNLWMRPEMHGLPRTDAADAQVAQKSVDALVRKAPDVTQWILHLPDDRDPAVNMLWRSTGNGRFETLRMNPQTGEPIEARQTRGGDFFYRFGILLLIQEFFELVFHGNFNRTTNLRKNAAIVDLFLPEFSSEGF